MWDEQWTSSVLSQVLLASAWFCTLPAAFVLLEVLYANRKDHRATRKSTVPLNAVVIVPAHNEEIEIGKTLQALQNECAPGTRIVVVADHCTDETVKIAKSYPVEVLERDASSAPGKSYALADAVRMLKATPPDVVVFVDADSQFIPGGLRRLIECTHRQQRPEQSIYVMEPPAHPAFHGKLSAFAFQFKNEIRAKGLHAMKAPCQLTGSGMAFPWDQVRDLPLESESLVEDLELGISLAVRGNPAFLCEEAKLISRLPGSETAAIQQRRRWEHGYLRSVLPGVARLLLAAMRNRKPKLMLLALDLCVPPLSFLSLIIGLGWLLSLMAAMLGLSSWKAWSQWSLSGAFLCSAVTIAVSTYPNAYIRFRDLAQVPRYLIWKAPVVLSFFYRSEREWKRTERRHPSIP